MKIIITCSSSAHIHACNGIGVKRKAHRKQRTDRLMQLQQDSRAARHVSVINREGREAKLKGL